MQLSGRFDPQEARSLRVRWSDEVCPNCESKMVWTIDPQDDVTPKMVTDKVSRRCFSCGREWSLSILDDLEVW